MIAATAVYGSGLEDEKANNIVLVVTPIMCATSTNQHIGTIGVGY